MKKVISLFDENTGELFSRVEKNTSTILGGEWIVFYDSAIRKILEDNPDYSTVKVLLQLMSMQTFDVYTITTIQSVAKKLKMSYKTAWSAVQWLEKNHYLKRSKVNGANAFILNPSMTTRGRSSMAQKRTIWSLDLTKEVGSGRKVVSGAERSEPPADRSLKTSKEEE